MQAAMLRAFGSPLTIETLPNPAPGAGEAVIDVVAAPVLSYTDEDFSGARAFSLLLPLVPGCGAHGRVRAVGPGAARLADGDWVFCDTSESPRDDTRPPDLQL